MMTDLRTVETEVRDAVARFGREVCEIVLVSPLGERKGIRYAFRIDDHHGRTLKARHFGSEAEARRVYDLRLDLDDAFAPVLGRVGAVLLETWIEGAMLVPGETDAWVSATAGGILRRLHARPLPAGFPERQRTARWTEAAVADLELLQQARVLTAADGDAVGDALRRHDPGSARVGLIHKDFCGENMLVDRSGRLRIIDTEQLAVEPVAFDLAWTWHRWPLSAMSWAAFMEAYRGSAGPSPEAQDYWRLITGLTLARVFLQRMPERLDGQVARLNQCVAETARSRR